ncbi:MAG: alpha-hydroxy acid oxidase [Spongiibacteraceae bacterium]
MTKSQTPLTALNYIPAEILCAQDYEIAAQQFIAAPSYAYIAGGSAGDITLAANRSVFAEYSLYPRLLNDVTNGSTHCQLGELQLPHPILLAPVAFQTLAHPLGEIETARGADAMTAGLIASTLSSRTLEEIAAATTSPRWFQLYFQPDRAVTLDLVRRAENAGYRAIVVTLDAAIQLPSQHAMRAGFQMPVDCVAANLRNYPTPQPVALNAADSRVFRGAMRHAPTWQYLDWLQQQTSLPIWIKGVLHPDDALALKQRGVNGLIVSNHGGRTLDGAVSTLDALPAIRNVVGNDFPILMDSGIRSGSDIFKAIALGADAVLIGRLQVFALSVAGALGVAHMLKLLREELEVCMAMTGCTSLADIRRTVLHVNTNIHKHKIFQSE